jgi:ribosomal subunit interface protein
MDIRISGHQVAIGDALKAHVQDRLQGIADKYFARAISAEVTFGKGPHDNGFTCDIVAHVTRGLILKGSHVAHDAHLVFDGTADKIEKQLRRRRIATATTMPAIRCSRSRSARTMPEMRRW